MPTEVDNKYEGTQQYEIVEEEEDVIDLRPNESDVEANVDVDIGVESEGRSNNDDDDDDEALLPTKTNRRAKFTGTVVGKRVKKWWLQTPDQHQHKPLILFCKNNTLLDVY